MGLDVYVGSLTRYYAGDWTTVIQQWAEETGVEFMVLRTQPEPQDAVHDQAEIRRAILTWRHTLSAGLKEHLDAPLDWDESDAAPYFTDRPGWEGLVGLLLWAAYEEHPEFARPSQIGEDWTGDPAWQASLAEGFRSRYPNLLRDAELWLPCDFPFTFRAQDPAGQEMMIGSSVALAHELRELNDRAWRADSEMLARWAQERPDGEGTLEPTAQFGFALFLHLAELSAEHRLPMKLDY